MSQTQDTLWEEMVTRLCTVFKQWQIKRAIVFGSWARDDVSRHSDLDLLVVQETSKRWLDRYDGLLREVSRVVPGRDVDLLIYTPQELVQLADRPFLVEVLREGKTIYESDKESASG